MDTWYQYRDVWSAHPWVLAVAALSALMIVAGLIGTITTSPLALVFIPGLALALGHHLIVGKKAG